MNAENCAIARAAGRHLESLHSARERLDVQSADTPELEDQLFARADRIAALEKSSGGWAAHAEKCALLGKNEQRSDHSTATS